jgi:hypothetical protein
MQRLSAALIGVAALQSVTALVGAQVDPIRGTWFWSDPEHVFGSAQVVGNPDRETYVRSVFAVWSIKRAYCSVGNRPIAEPDVIATWNSDLDDQGLTSMLLLSENTWIFPENHAALITLIQTQLLDFNAAHADPRERFDGLHLDIEPHGLAEWSSLSPSERRDRLLLLRDTFAIVRSTLDDAGATGIGIYGDLPVWFDTMGGSIGWMSEADRDQFFADLDASLAGVSLMVFERSTFSEIQSGVQWELDNLTSEVRVALEADIGPGRTWQDFAEMMSMAEQIEAVWGPDIGIDIQSFTQLIDHAPPRVLFIDGFQIGSIGGWSGSAGLDPQ